MRGKRRQELVEAILETLCASERIKPFQVAKREVLKRYGLQGTGKDRYITALVYKIYRSLGELDRIIEESVKTSTRDLPLCVKQAARLAAFLGAKSEPRDPHLEEELLEKGLRILAEKHGWKMARIVARVLKKARRLRGARIEQTTLMPSELYERIEAILGESEARELAEVIKKPPTPALRVNSLKTSVERVLEYLRENGVEAWISRRVPGVVFYKGGFREPVKKLVERGEAVPQDESSAAAVLFLDPKPGETIVDLCAAPGGKTTHIAEYTKLQSTIIAVELYSDRIERLRELAVRTSTYTAIHPVVGDARQAATLLGEEVADKVLVDPPCTSTGALAKHPDAMWRFSRESLEKLVVKQREIIEQGYKLIKPGGRMLYTVCSLLPEEGEEVVKWLLRGHKEARLIPLPKIYDESSILRGAQRAWPHRHRVTGFFYALIEKRSRK